MKTKRVTIISGSAILAFAVVIVILSIFKSDDACPDTKLLIDIFEKRTSLDTLRNEQVTKAIEWLKNNNSTEPVLLDAAVIDSLADDFKYAVKVYFLDRSRSVHRINFRSNDNTIEIENIIDPYLIESTYCYGYIDHKYLRPIISTDSDLGQISDEYWKKNCLLLTPELLKIILDGKGEIVLYDEKKNLLDKIDLDIRVINNVNCIE